MRAYPGLPARAGERRADGALSPQAPGGHDQRGRKHPLSPARPGIAESAGVSGIAANSPTGTLRLPVADVNHDHGYRGADRLVVHREHRRLHAADLDRARRPAPAAHDRRGGAAWPGVQPSVRRPVRAGDLDRLPGQRRGHAGLARCPADRDRYHPGHLHGHPVDSLPDQARCRAPGRAGAARRARGGPRPVHRHRRDDRQPARQAVPGQAAAQAGTGSAGSRRPRFRRDGHVRPGRGDRDQREVRDAPIGRLGRSSGRLESWQRS
jgi:hypothetical protein